MEGTPLDQEEIKEGRQIGRAELYIATHTRKNGQPIDDYSGDKIDEIQRRFQEDPSLTAEDTHDNDLFSTLFPKERSGRRTGLGSQRCPSVDSSPRISTVPRHDLHDMNDDNQESISCSNKRHGVELEETRNVMLPSLQKRKREIAQHTLLGNTKGKTPPQSLPETSKKTGKFQTPLHKDDMEDIKCGMEVGLASPNSKKLVALGTIKKTDRKGKANDGQPLADYIEIICSDGSQLQSKFCSSISQITVNTRETPGPKRSTSKSYKADAGRLNKGQVASQNLAKNKTARRKACKEKPKEPTSSQIVQSRTSNIHITTSRC